MPEPFSPGTLAAALEERTAAARSRGALRPVATDEAVVEQGGIRFIVRSLATLAGKDRTRRRRAGAPPDPFGPWEPELFVADVSNTHVALLNKFPVLQRHLLVVTRRFEHQEALLDAADLAAVARCLDELDALAFYNAGPEAGASQTHKHLQLVPSGLGGAGAAPPVQPLLDAATGVPEAPGRVAGLPFEHAFARLSERSPAGLLACYRALLHATGMDARPPAGPGASEARQSGPYNLLLARDWMLLVPRRCAGWRDVSINALGFAGSLFVRTPADLATVRAAGPLAVLRAVSLPRRDAV